MAVEIPVVIDIQEAFNQAAAQVPTASKPLVAQVEQVSKRINNAIKNMQKAPVKFAEGGNVEELNTSMTKYANTVRLAGQQMLRLGMAQGKLSAGRVNIRAVSTELAVLASKWNSMKLGAKFDADGKLRNRAQEVLDRMSRLTGQATRFGQALASSSVQGARGMNQLAASTRATNTALATQSGLLARLTKYLSGYMLLFAGYRFVHNVRETTAELELQRVALTGILNDAKMASELFREIKAAALKSPFEIKELITFTKQLAAYRIENEKLFKVTQQLADISAGLGVDMNRLVLAYGQVRAAAVLRGQELRQFTEAGIPLVELLKDKFIELGRAGTTTADVFELMQKRAIPFSMIESIFNDMTSAGNIFYKMQEKQSETLWGQWQKLRDAITIMYDEIGNTKVVHDAMVAFIKDLQSLTRSWQEVSRWIGTVIGMVISYKLAAKAAVLATNSITKAEAARLAIMKAHGVTMPKVIASIVGETAAKKASIWMTKRLAVAQYNLAAATTLAGKAFWGLYAAIMSNPFGLAAAAVVGLGLGVYTLIKNSKEAAITIDALEASITNFKTAASKAGDTESMVAAYENLKNKAELTQKEQEKLDRVTRELAKTFPSAVNGIDNESEALEVNIGKVKDLIKAEQDLQEARLKRDAKRARERVRELQEERQEIIDIVNAGGYWSNELTNPKFNLLNEDDLAKYGDRLFEIMQELEPLQERLEDIEELFLIGPVLPKGVEAEKQLVPWKKLLSDIHNEMIGIGETQILTPQDIEQMKDMNALWKATKKGIEDAKKQSESLKAIQDTLPTEELKQANEDAINATKKELDFWERVKEVFGFIFKQSKSAGYQKDYFITLMENRMKFMQDFKKGYDDLEKYVGKSMALTKESGIMRERGLSLDLGEDEQKKAAEQLSEWYRSQIDKVLAEMRRKGLRAESLSEVLSQKIVGNTNRDKMIRDYQKLLQSLWDAKTDFDVSQQKKAFDDALKRLKDEIKRSETARKFYQDVFDTTGDKDLAISMAVDVYGDVGQNFKENMQRQIARLLEEIDTSKLSAELNKAFQEMDFKTILEHLDEIPEKVRSSFEEMAKDSQKFQQDQMLGWLKELQKAKTYAQQRIEIAQKTEKRIAEINASGLSNDQKSTLVAQYAQKEAEDVAKLQYEVFKDSPMYVDLFSNLDAASGRMLKNMRANLVNLKSQWKNLDPDNLKEMQARLNEVDKQLARRNPFKSLISSIKEYADKMEETGGGKKQAERAAIAARETANREMRTLEWRRQSVKLAEEHFGVDSNSYKMAVQNMKAQEKRTDGAIKAAEAAEREASAWKDIVGRINDAAEAIDDFNGDINKMLDGTQQIVNTFATDDEEEFFGIAVDGMKSLFGGIAELATGVARLMAGDVVGGIASIVKGIGDVIEGTFGAEQKAKIKRMDDEIERQQNLISDLEYTYERLENAIADAFGSDYIARYQQQLEALYAKQSAYEAQAQAERGKGKKADEQKIKDYEVQARETADQISDMQSQLAEFFTGTDVTSAATDFANAWIEAYKQFGSTTDAMKEKFRDFVDNMITNSLAAKLMQTILDPLFREIDEYAQSGDELTAREIADIAQRSPEYIERINNAMSTLMNQLAAAGYNVREKVGTFTGISRDIANASEESITGLAAGINTQNFYMSHIDQNVAAILAALTGGTATNAEGATVVTDPYKDQMLQYAAYIPMMHDNVVAIRSLLDKVIRPVGTTSTYRMIVG